MHRENRIAVICGATVVVIVAIYFRINPDPGFFASRFIAELMLDQGDGHLDVSMRSNVPGLKPLIASVQSVTGLSHPTILALPLAVVGRAMLYFVIIRYFTRSNAVSAFGALSIATNPWQGWGYNILFVHGVGSVLFLTFVFTVFKGRDSNKKSIQLVQLLTFVGLFLLDYTATAWALGLLFVLEATSVIDPFRRGQHIGVLAFAGVLVGQKHTIVSFLSISLGLSMANEASTVYQYTPESKAFSASTVYYYSIAAVGLMYGIWLLNSQLQRRSLNMCEFDRKVASLTAAGMIITILYLAIGRFTQFFIFLCGPLIGIIAAYRFNNMYLNDLNLVTKNQLLTIALVIILVSSSSIAFIGVATSEINSAGKYSENKIGAHIVKYSGSSVVLADLHKHGSLLIAAAERNEMYKYRTYNEKQYESLVEGRAVDADFVVIDYSDSDGVSTIGWNRFENLNKHRSSINNNHQLDKVYASNEIIYSVNKDTKD